MIEVQKEIDRHKYWACWQLESEKGRQVWRFKPPENADNQILEKEIFNAFKFNKAQNPNSGDLVYRTRAIQKGFKELSSGQKKTEDKNETNLKAASANAAKKALNFYQCLQMEDGHWPGDYGGPMFLLPGLVVASYISETPFPVVYHALMRRYMLNHQNKDGGWGLHIEGQSTMFGTVMQYVALRLLGAEPHAPEMTSARTWINAHGGATGIPSWGKFYLAVIGAYEWEGCNSLFPEMWLLPRSLPFHPGRFWCHSRMVYMPMSYCYGHKVKGPETELVLELRKEIFIEDYDTINWKKTRNQIAEPDLYKPHSSVLKLLNKVTNFYEKIFVKKWRKKALDFLLSYVDAEDRQTEYVDIGPVNQVINSICVWHAYGKESKQFKAHVDRWKDYLWVAEDGMKMNGYNGSQLWDTTFAVQAIIEGGLEANFPEPVKAAYRYIDISQVQEDVDERDKFFRHASKGGWPFSTIDHGWPITDCTAEGLKAAMMIHNSPYLESLEQTIGEQRLKDAVDLLLSFQNSNGGWATYELTRGPGWLEVLNAAEVYKNIMIDYAWTECTSACIQALKTFRKTYAAYKKPEVDQAIKKGGAFLEHKQRADGSWLGSWAVCFTYGTWFGVEGLIASGHTPYGNPVKTVSKHIEKACEFLVSKQNEDGGWGEAFESCVQSDYVPHENSQVVNTSWALLTLMAANYPDVAPIERGMRLLMDRQLDNGDWNQEAISGVFNNNCMITYTAYRNVFPMWALGRYSQMKGY
ncbi:MAG: terpene cyclase/mutase family protein [Bacteroidota bacterium]